MYRILPFAVLLFSAIPLPVLAQEAGLHLSVAHTSLSDPSEGEDPATRPGGGISLDFPLSDNVGLLTGVFYACKGISCSVRKFR